MDDRLLYNRGQEWLHMHHIVGRAVGFLPHVGMVTILMNDYPWLKVALIAVLGLLVVTSKE
jgi:signal peptidase